MTDLTENFSNFSENTGKKFYQNINEKEKNLLRRYFDNHVVQYFEIINNKLKVNSYDLLK